jgi:hypothetical protein
MSGNETVGRTLVTYICLFMVLDGRPAGAWWRARQEHRRHPCRERATAHRSRGSAAATDSAIYLQHSSHEPMSADTMCAMANTSDRVRVSLVAVTVVAQA